MNATFKRPYGNHKTNAVSGAINGAASGIPRTADAKLRDIAQSLDIMVSELHLLADRAPEGAVHHPPLAASTVERAMQAYRDRRRREQVFGDASLFGEPAWDIMLDLFVAAAQEKRIAVTSACIGSAVPATTALRWIKILEDRGLIEREVDEGDARRTFVRLSPRGCDLMEEFLTS
jgi:predicted transcriptional regulator